MPLRSLTVDQLEIRDERSFRHIALYARLKELLVADGFRFRVPLPGSSARWDRVLFLNLTFWNASEPTDVLVEAAIDADVVAHAAWHHACRKALSDAPASPPALFLGESIASAFDLYLVGRVLGHAPDSGFLETQVPAMADVAQGAGLDEHQFEALLESVVADPDRAFEDLRQLLFDVSNRLFQCDGVDAAADALESFSSHRFASLLHHYELSNWVLYARAYAANATADPRVDAIDHALRDAPVALDWLEKKWLS